MAKEWSRNEYMDGLDLVNFRVAEEVITHCHRSGGTLSADLVEAFRPWLEARGFDLKSPVNVYIDTEQRSDGYYFRQ